jgi:hypothetical protein
MLGKRFLAYLPALFFLPVVLAPALNHDVAALLDFSGRWLDGEALYSRLIDANPPLIFVLNIVPAALARFASLEPVTALLLCLLIYGAMVWWLALRVRRLEAEGPVERMFLDAAPLLMLVGGGSDFGQREHLMVVGALPYLFAATERARGVRPPHRYAVAMLAAVVFGIKPHFLGLPALVELYVLRVRGPRAMVRDPIPWTMALVWIAYLASIPLFFPDYLKITLPLVFTNYLDFGQVPLWSVITMPGMGIALAALVPLSLVAIVARDTMGRIFALAALGAAASALAQHKGWSYQLLPVELFVLALAGILAARWLDGHCGFVVRYPHAVACSLVVLCVVYVIYDNGTPARKLEYPNGQAGMLSRLLKQADTNRRILVLSPGVWPIYPAVNYAHMKTTTRSISMWVYVECAADGKSLHEIADMNWAERFMFEAIVQDFTADSPGVVMANRVWGDMRCGYNTDFIAYFTRDPRFADAWSRYRSFAEDEDFRVYVRSTP